MITTVNNKKTCKIIGIFGPMFSGKTTELFRRLYRYEEIYPKKVKLIGSSKYNREKNQTQISSHNGYIMHNCIKIENLSGLEKYTNEFSDIEVIGIDEIQFFESSAYELCNNWCRKYNLIIVVAGLNLTFECKPWKTSLRFFGHCDEFTTLQGICKDCRSENGIYSHRIELNNKNKILIGGKDKYICLCRNCFYNKTTEKNKNK